MVFTNFPQNCVYWNWITISSSDQITNGNKNITNWFINISNSATQKKVKKVISRFGCIHLGRNPNTKYFKP